MLGAERISSILRGPDHEKKSTLKDAAIDLRETALKAAGSFEDRPRITLPRYQSDESYFRLAPGNGVDFRIPRIEEGKGRVVLTLYVSESGETNAREEREIDKRIVTRQREVTPEEIREIAQGIEAHGAVRLDTQLHLNGQESTANQAA